MAAPDPSPYQPFHPEGHPGLGTLPADPPYVPENLVSIYASDTGRHLGHFNPEHDGSTIAKLQAVGYIVY